MAQVFISYSRKDKEFVQKLVAGLLAEKREVWLDEKNIEPTAEWLKEIFDNIEAADNFLFVISPNSVVSTYARKEIDHAALNNKRIVPIYYQPVPDKDIPEAVAKFQRIDFTGPDGFDAKVAKLIAALDTDLEWVETLKRIRSTILTSQLPISRWHEQIGDPTIADGILDRLVHNAHRIEMRGESMRKKRNPPQDEKKE